MLNLALLPTCCRRAGGGLDHVVVGHDQEAPVEDPLLASEHGRHRGLHVVVDPARRHAAEERERPRMGIEHHLLRLTGIGSHVHSPRRAQPHMCDLHAHRLAGDLHILVAPVELVCLAGPEHQRDERRSAVTCILAPLVQPALRITPDSIVGDRQTLS